MNNMDFLESFIHDDYNNGNINEYTTDLLLDIITEAKSKADEFYDNVNDKTMKDTAKSVKKNIGKAKDLYVKGVKTAAGGAAKYGVAPINNKFNNLLNKTGEKMLAHAEKTRKKIPANLEEKYRKRILGIKMASKVGIAVATNALLTPIPIPASNLALNLIYTTTISLSEDPDDKIVVAKAKAIADKSKDLMDKLKGFANKKDKSDNSSKKSSVASVPKSFITNLMNHIRNYDKFANWYNNEKVDAYTKKLENIRKTDGKLMKDVKEHVEDIVDAIYESYDNNEINILEREELLDYLNSKYNIYIETHY